MIDTFAIRCSILRLAFSGKLSEQAEVDGTATDILNKINAKKDISQTENVPYQPRSFDMTFSMLGDRSDFDRLVSAAVNQFAGQLCRVTLTEDPTLYALGTLEADPTYDPLTGKGSLVLSCTDGDAFLYYVEETVESITGSGTVILHNDYMPVVPVITTTAETTLRWAIDGESFHKTVSAGTWEITELELRHGDNTVSVTGEGTTTFTYRQGRL